MHAHMPHVQHAQCLIVKEVLGFDRLLGGQRIDTGGRMQLLSRSSARVLASQRFNHGIRKVLA